MSGTISAWRELLTANGQPAWSVPPKPHMLRRITQDPVL